MSEYGLQSVIKLGLLQNIALLKFECRLNPGYTQKVKHNNAIVMIKNIQNLRIKNLPVDESILDPSLYAYDIDHEILSKLGLKNPYLSCKKDKDGLTDILEFLGTTLSSIRTPKKKNKPESLTSKCYRTEIQKKSLLS
jgi:hypothetical protein